MKIFDAHIKIGKWGKWPINGKEVNPFKDELESASDFSAFMKKHNITKCVAVPHYVPDQKVPFKEYNTLLLKACGNIKGLFGAVWVSPLAENTALTAAVLGMKLPKEIKALKMSADSWPKGTTMNPETWDDKFRENMEACIDFANKKKFLFHFHTGSGNSAMKEFYPFVKQYGDKIRMQFVHMGSSAGGLFAFVPRFMEWIDEGYDFYCDTSFCRSFGPKWFIEKALRENREKVLDRIFFASDYPWNVYESELAKITALDIDAKIKNKVLYENANKVYGDI